MNQILKRLLGRRYIKIRNWNLKRKVKNIMKTLCRNVVKMLRQKQFFHMLLVYSKTKNKRSLAQKL